MIKQFEKLSAEEISILLDAPVYITILISGADGKIDEAEKDWAIKLADLRRFAGDIELRDYYKTVDDEFVKKLEEQISFLPKDLIARNQALTTELSKTNAVLAKIDQAFAGHIYKSWISFAGHVARSSGGVLGFGSISPAEKEVIGLSMIQQP